MDDSGSYYLQMFGFPILLALPTLLVILAGMGFSIFQYRKAPKASILTIAALVLFLLLSLNIVVQPFLNSLLINGSIDQTSFMYIMSGISILASLVGAIALGLLITAVWLQRN